MKLENQVCLSHQSRKLKELGIKQESWCHWAQNINTGDEIKLFVNGVKPFIGKREFAISYSAFSVAELGTMLGVNTQGILPEKYNKKEVNAWFALNASYYQTEADLRAGILIYLLETGLLATSTCNERL